MNRLRLRQIIAVARLEAVRCLFTLRAAPLYLLAFLPVLVSGLVLLLTLFLEQRPGEDLHQNATLFSAVMYEFILRFVIYSGCVWVFMNLFRAEILDRSLHYYFLAPIRRDVLVAGKFLAGWLASSVLFLGSTLATMLVLRLASRAGGSAALEAGTGGGPLSVYLVVTLLACLGYGAIFLVIGLFLRNPIVPALVIFLWEQVNPFLPALLKKISVIFYLKSLLPVALDQGPFAVLAEPAPAWLAVPGLLLFTAVLLVGAGLRVRRVEIAYGDD
jgi:ABC-type transport system involved in multi-copper enzyme maturation permease subunit